MASLWMPPGGQKYNDFSGWEREISPLRLESLRMLNYVERQKRKTRHIRNVPGQTFQVGSKAGYAEERAKKNRLQRKE